jgi:phenylpropionate dioxygenase-like ring-hydroxylating dioxygenase large terminal subunit
MLHREQVRQARKLLDYLDTGTTAMAEGIYANPVTDYICAEQAAAERDRLFRRWPLNLGLSCRAPAPGDYFEEDWSGVPILVVRGRDKVLRAFMNVCRHRGARVALGCGKARNFVCPYHAWTYDLDGALRGRPHDAAFAEAPAATHGLVPLPIEERHGMIWVGATRDTPIDLDRQLGGLNEEMAAYGLDRYHHYETRILRRDMNWKLVVDTFLELYHLSTLHPTTVGPILYTDRSCFDGFGHNLRLIGARKTIHQMKEQPEAEWDLVTHTAIVYVLFPNTVFIMQGDHVETWHVYPDLSAGDGVERAAMYVSLYTPEPAATDSARGHWERNFDLLMATVEQEDFPLGERVQRGFHAGAQPHITFGRNEPALQHFHKSIAAELANSAA